jgi:hypothetical protein
VGQPVLLPSNVVPANNAVPANPCQYSGRALPPGAYATQGQAANGSPTNFALDVAMGLPRGDYLDPQPLTDAPPLQAAAYGNYAYGVYMQAAGFTLSQPLSGANTYAWERSLFNPQQYANQPMDPNYSSLPITNVANITNGYERHSSSVVLCCESAPSSASGVFQ